MVAEVWVGVAHEYLLGAEVWVAVVADLRLLQLESRRPLQVWANQRWRSEFVEPSLVLLEGGQPAM